MLISKYRIDLMCEGMRRIKRVPEREWLEPIIHRLELLKPGESMTITVTERATQLTKID